MVLVLSGCASMPNKQEWDENQSLYPHEVDRPSLSWKAFDNNF